MMDVVTLDIILEKYGTSGISAVLRILHVEDEELGFNTYRPSATSEMADDLEKALDEYKERTKG